MTMINNIGEQPIVIKDKTSNAFINGLINV